MLAKSYRRAPRSSRSVADRSSFRRAQGRMISPVSAPTLTSWWMPQHAPRPARQGQPHPQPPHRHPVVPLAAFYRTAILVINGRTVCGVPVDSGYWGSNVSCGRRYEGFSPSLSALSSARTATATLEPTMSSAAATGCKWPEAASAMPARL